MALAVIPAFFIGRRLAGNIGGLFAGIVVAIHPAILTRTIAGFSDTDAYNIFFPLMIVWLTLLLFEAEGLKKKSIYGGLTGLTMGIYLFAWNNEMRKRIVAKANMNFHVAVCVCFVMT